MDFAKKDEAKSNGYPVIDPSDTSLFSSSDTKGIIIIERSRRFGVESAVGMTANFVLLWLARDHQHPSIRLEYLDASSPFPGQSKGGVALTAGCWQVLAGRAHEGQCWLVLRVLRLSIFLCLCAAC